VGDFLGGFTSRRLPLLWVLFFTQLVGLVVVLPFAVARGAPPFDNAAVAAAMLGSLSGLIGIAALYRAIALGVASVAAPISATGAVLPVAFGLLRGESIGPLQQVGLVCAIVGVVFASRTSQAQAHLGREAQIGIVFAIVAAVGFGGFFILLHEASTRDVWWAVTLQRATGSVVIGILALATRTRWTLKPADALPLVATGTLDQAANVLYALASTVGFVSLAAVLASLYPIGTMVLARLILNERISGLQKSGVALALTGVALIAGR
jgi:drug/metabolite transporter (DMT)-like permease